MTTTPFAQSGKRVTADETAEWLRSGFKRLPASLRGIVLTGETACIALIYEFERASEADMVVIRLPGMIQGRDHLVKAGIWRSLQE